MSHPISLPQPTSLLPNPSFSSWLKHNALLFSSQILGGIAAIASLIYYVENVYEHTELKDLNRHLLLWSDCAHLLFIFLFICVLIHVLDDNDRGRYHARKVQERVFNEKLSQKHQEALLSDGQAQIAHFKRYFLFFWITMFILYLAFTGKHLSASGGHSTAIGSIGELINGSIFPFLTFALNNISLWCVFLCFTVLYLPASDEQSTRKRKRMIRFSALALCIFILLFPMLIFSNSFTIISRNGLTLVNYFTLFDAISGILNALVVAMLIARLDSKLIGLRSWLILILYSYSAVQPLFAVFEQPDLVFQEIQTVVLIAVFLLKVYFFLIIFYALQTGRMLNYVFCFPILNRLIDAIFENQFEIKEERESANSFRFFITNDDRHAYTSDRSFALREDCERFIEKLREVARCKESYNPRNKFGTHWVEIIVESEVLCHSVDLRSEHEVKEFIEESIEKLPYCKYVRVQVRSTEAH